MAKTADKTIKELVDKMKGYLNMESEIEYQEFVGFYKTVTELMQADFGDLDQNQLISMGAICQIVGLNAVDRCKNKDDNQKKFKKMGEKAQFWFDAANYKLNKEFGMAKPEIETATSKVFEDEK